MSERSILDLNDKAIRIRGEYDYHIASRDITWETDNLEDADTFSIACNGNKSYHKSRVMEEKVLDDADDTFICDNCLEKIEKMNREMFGRLTRLLE